MGNMNDLTGKATILVVDDTPDNLMLMNGLLKNDYIVKAANSGPLALKIASLVPPPDLILLDIMMPVMDGYEVLRQLRAQPKTRDIPVIFLTAKADTQDEKIGLELGAADYITKPISPPIVMARVVTQLKIKAAADFLKNQNDYLEKEVARRTRQLQVIQDVTINGMASLAETRDNQTGNHIRRTQFYMRLLAQELQGHPRFASDLSDEHIDMLFKSAPLHDIGKVGIPDRILLKPDKLTSEEFEIMKTHAALGKDTIVAAERSIGVSVDFLDVAKDIAFSHHEKWDGTGYPQGLAGDVIPLAARLMAVADVYDALISSRVYKKALTHEEAMSHIKKGRGTHFDPDIVDAFLVNHGRFQAIAKQFVDAD